jgi:parvulin-like peptidyl-prolyl isomerase
MPKSKNSRLIIFLAILVWLIALIAGFYVWLASPPLTNAKTKAFQVMPFPLALVNNEPVFMKDFLRRWDLAQSFAAPQAASEPEKVKSAIVNQMIQEKKMSLIAKTLKVGVTKAQIDSEYQRILDSEPDLPKQLAQYNLTSDDLKNFIVGPQMLLINLQIWLNSQKDLHSKEYALAANLIDRLRGGEDMAALAKNYSQDQFNQPFGGDLGFVDLSSLLPELQSEISAMSVGDIKLLASRNGLHVIKLENKSSDKYYLRQIFLPINDFDQWLAIQTAGYRIKTLIQP